MLLGEWSEGQSDAAERRDPGTIAASFDEEEASESTPGKGHAPSSDMRLSPGHENIPPSNCADPCNGSSIASEKKFMLDMLFSKKAPVELERALPVPADEHQAGAGHKNSQEEKSSRRAKGPEVHSDVQTRLLRAQSSIDAEASLQNLEGTLMTPFRRDSEVAQDPLVLQPQLLKIRDLDFSDLGEEEDFDVLETEVVEKMSFHTSQHPAGFMPPPPPPGCPPPPPPLSCPPPPPPPPPGCPPPPPPPGLQGSYTDDAHSPAKKKKTVKLFWRELKNADSSAGGGRFGQATLWTSLEKVEVDTAKLEHLFESRAKEVLSSKVGFQSTSSLLLCLQAFVALRAAGEYLSPCSAKVSYSKGLEHLLAMERDPNVGDEEAELSLAQDLPPQGLQRMYHPWSLAARG